MIKRSDNKFICSNCGKSIEPHEVSSLILGRCRDRDFILCSNCKDKTDDFIKWSDEE